VVIEDFTLGSDATHTVRNQSSYTQATDAVMSAVESSHKPASTLCISVRDPRAQNR